MIILSIGTVIIMAFSNQYLAVDLQTNIEAISKAKKMLEEARVLSRQNFYTVTSIPAGYDGIYEKNLNVEDIDSYTKRVTANVRWSAEGGRHPSITFVTLVTNPTNTCTQSLVGDWANPKIINTSKIDIDSSSNLTSIIATNGYVYMTGDSATASKNDFYIVNTANPALPMLSGSLTTGPGLNAVSVFGNYAYVANSSINSQLQVINITSKNNPTLYKSFKLPTSDSDVGTVGYSITYHSGKVYLGTKKNGKAGLHIIDVSDLNNIHEVGYLEVNNTINQIRIVGNYAYVLSDDNTQELRVLNISTPSTITSVSIYNASGTSGFGYGKSLAMSGSSLFFGRTFDPNANSKELLILNNTNPTINPLPALHSQKIAQSINGIILKSNLIFLAASSQFQVRKVSDLSVQGSLALPSNSVGMDCSGDYIYLGVLGDSTSTNKDVLKIIGAGP